MALMSARNLTAASKTDIFLAVTITVFLGIVVVSLVPEAADKPYSYVITTTKAMPDISDPRTVTFQVERDLYHSAKALNQGSYYHWNGDHLTTILRDLGAMLKTGGSEMTIATEIQHKKFAKTFWNVAFSSFSTFTRFSPATIFRPPPKKGQSYSPYVAPQTAPDVIPVLRHALDYPDNEHGLPSSSLIDDISLRTAKIHRDSAHTALPSMLLDAQNGLPIEVEMIFGEVVRIAKEVGVNVPKAQTLDTETFRYRILPISAVDFGGLTIGFMCHYGPLWVPQLLSLVVFEPPPNMTSSCDGSPL
ncbi:hypothetical protein BDR07DRAFT_1373646 [Suillus spraguei]|nr:hypothetical protein BDR07DRAFT_1373646 [Suillus spraguei]